MSRKYIGGFMIVVSTIHHENNYQDIDLKCGMKRINFGGYRVD